MASLSLVNVCKTYKNGFEAVKDVNLDIRDKEFLILVGPSGCGKSTTLRMIAGLEDISSGQLWIDGQLVNMLEPKNRDLSMVFQNYALYPHMTVYQNMAFGLKVRKTPKEEIDRRVRQAAKILDIAHLLDRKPHALSGGQKQRVAIARAMATQPKILLLDEPAAGMNAQEKEELIRTIRGIRNDFGISVLIVEHDMDLIMNISDDITVLNYGARIAHGVPEEIQNNEEVVEAYLGRSDS